jgi:hypothetical protein
MAVAFRGAWNSGGAANPNGTDAATWTLPASCQVGDTAVCVLYSRASTKTFTGITGPTLISGQDVSNATYGHLWVGSVALTQQMIDDGYVGHATLNSVSNGTTGWMTAVFYQTGGVRSAATPATGTGDPNPPSYSSTSGDCLIAIGGGMDQNDGISASANFTLNANAAWSTTSGTDGWSALEYDLDGGTGSAVDPAVMATVTDSAWYTTVLGLKKEYNQTPTPTGIASAQAIGTPTVKMQLQIRTPTGIASAESVGTPTITADGYWYDWNGFSSQPDGTGTGQYTSVGVSGDGAVVLAGRYKSSTAVNEFLSTNHGATWAAMSPQPFGTTGYEPHVLRMDSDGSVRLAASIYGNKRIYHSIDSGASFHEEYPTGSGVDKPWADAVISDDGSRILVAISENGTGRLYYTSNGGTSWSAAIDPSAGGGQMYWGSIAMSDDGTKMMACDQAGYLWHSVNSGGAWHREDPSGSAETGIWFVAMSEDGTKIIAGLTQDQSFDVGRVWTTTNGGTNWTLRNFTGEGTSTGNPYGLAISGDGSTWLICSYSTVNAAHCCLYGSSDGATWAKWGPVQSGVNMRYLALSDDGIYIVAASGLADGRFFYSTTGLLAWRHCTAVGIVSAQAIGTPTVLKTNVVTPTGIASAESIGSAAASQTGGTTTRVPTGIASSEAIGSPTTLKGNVTRTPSGIASSEQVGTPNIAYTQTRTASGIASAEAVGTATATHTDQSRTASGVASAEAMGTATTLLANFVYHDIAWAESLPSGSSGSYYRALGLDADGSVILAGQYHSLGHLYLSTNSGDSWTLKEPAGAGVHRYWLEADCSDDGQVLLAIGGTSSSYSYLYLSTNGGSSWNVVSPIDASGYNWQGCAVSGDGQTLIAGVYGGRLYHSTNQGSNWHEEQPAGVVDKNWGTVGIDYDGSVMAICFSGNGVYVTTNGGTNWYLRSVNNVETLDVDHADGSVIVINGYRTVYVSTDSGATFPEHKPSTTVQNYSVVGVADDNQSIIAASAKQTFEPVLPGRVYVSWNAGALWGEERPEVDAEYYWNKVEWRGHILWADYFVSATTGKAFLGKVNQRIIPTGIASGQSMGTVDTVGGSTGAQTVHASGIASAESVGTVVAAIAQTAQPAGIASAEAVGTPTASHTDQSRSLTGIASAESVGTATRVPGNVNRALSGIVSAESVGTATTAKGNVNCTPSGVASAEAVGNATRVPANAFGVAGIASGEAMGSATTLKGNVTRICTGIASAEAVGSCTWTTANVVGNAGGIASAEAVGTVKWHLVRLATGIASAEAVGTASRAAAYPVLATGIASAESVGVATRTMTVDRAPAGIASAESIGTAARQASNACAPAGINSAAVVGTVTVAKGGVTRQPTGIASAEEMGVPSTASGMTRSLAGIASAESVGAPKVNITVPVVGIASAEMVGVVAREATIARAPGGITSEEVIGVAQASHTDTERSPLGVVSCEAFGNPNRVSTVTRQPGGVASAEAIGSAVRAPGGVTRETNGIESGEAVGNAVAELVGGLGQTRAPTGIPSTEAVGSVTTAQGNVTRSPVGVASAEQVGSPTRVANKTPAIAGIASGEFMGTPTVVKANIIQPTGIASGQQMGSPSRLPGPVTRVPVGITSSEAFGSPAELLRYLIEAAGIVSEETFGSPNRLPGGVTRIPVGIASAELFGVVWAGSDLQVVYPAGIASAFQIGQAWVFIESDIEAVGGEHVQRASRAGRSRVSSERKPPEPRTENHTGRMR